MKSYLITDNSFYQFDFEKVLINIYRKYLPEYSCFRDKKNENFLEFFNIFLKVSKKFAIKNILINSHIELAIEHNIGIHLTSNQLDQIDFCKSKGLFVIASTHNINEIQLSNRADAITISPIFKSPNKGKPIGISSLNSLLNESKVKKVFALGGITTEKEIDIIKQQSPKCYGFASIRYFFKDIS